MSEAWGMSHPDGALRATGVRHIYLIIYLSSEPKPSAVILLHALLGRGDVLEEVGQVLRSDDLEEGFAWMGELTPNSLIDFQATSNLINS